MAQDIFELPGPPVHSIAVNKVKLTQIMQEQSQDEKNREVLIRS